jgi:hypothetical protein
MEDVQLDQPPSDLFARDFGALIPMDQALLALDKEFTGLGDAGLTELPSP